MTFFTTQTTPLSSRPFNFLDARTLLEIPVFDYIVNFILAWLGFSHS